MAATNLWPAPSRYDLTWYFGNATSFAVTHNPLNNTSLDGNVLVVFGAGRNTGYPIGVTASNDGGDTLQFLDVQESGAYPTIKKGVREQPGDPEPL